MDAAETEIQIDPQQALAGLGYPEVSDVRPVTGGWETLLWRFTTPDGARHSLRVYHVARVRPLASRERTTLETCEQAGLPAPRVEAAGHVDGSPALVLSWVPGVPIFSFIEKRPWTLGRYGRMFGRAQAQIHAAKPPEEFVAGAPEDWVMRVSDRYRDLAEHALTLNLRTDCLIHMDYHPLNVLSDGKVLTGVVDWAGGSAGDPRADLARTEVTVLAAPIPPGPMAPILNMIRKLLLRAWQRGYEEVAGPAPDFRPLRAWAGATLLTEIEPVIDNPNVWGTEKDIANFRRLIEVWAREAGIRG